MVKITENTEKTWVVSYNEKHKDGTVVRKKITVSSTEWEDVQIKSSIKASDVYEFQLSIAEN